MNPTATPERYAHAFRSLWASHGVTHESKRCPRRCGGRVQIDWEAQTFRCESCRYLGRGVVDLVRLRARLRDPYRVSDGCDPMPSAEGCPTPYRLLLERHGEMKLVPKACRRRTCYHCGPEHVQRRVAQLGPLLEAQPIYMLEGHHASWPTQYKRIQRSGGDYVRVPRPSGWRTFTTIPVPGSTPVPAEDVRSLLALAYSSAEVSQHESASSAWQASTLGSEEDRETESLLRDLLGESEPWTHLAYTSLHRLLRANAKADPSFSADPTELRGSVFWQVPSDQLEHRKYLHEAGIHDPRVPPYSNLGPPSDLVLSAA